MSAPVATFKTNSQSCSVKDVTLKCDKLWTMGQQEAISRLSVPKKSVFSKSTKMVLVSDFGARAARIAAAYAEFYLERGEDGKPDLKGRFYWMGLAAFASKQVKCGLDFIPAEPYLTIGVPPYWPATSKDWQERAWQGKFLVVSRHICMALVL
ncbi:DUF2515 family protein [Pseudomonas sp. PAB10]|uniref:DUF2515 family protein n=1 Tax=Pseudomonas sp. PAB10 TaxID=3233047 RepID=UPI003F9BFD8B